MNCEDDLGTTKAEGVRTRQLQNRIRLLPSSREVQRMEAAWRALAVEQDWLDGETQLGDKP